MPPKKTRQIATDVAAGVVTPAPGLRAQPTTPGIAVPAPSTPALMSPRSKGDKRSLLEEEKEDDHEEKKLDQSTSPRRAHEKRVIEISDDEDEKKAHVEVPRTPEAPMESAPTERSTQASPTSSGPHFAGVNAVEAHGDEEVGADYIPEDVMEEEVWGCGSEEGDDPPEVSEEELEQLDIMAKDKEINRMLEMPAVVEVDAEEVEINGGYIISTKEVMCWKRRLDQGGWFRRARLVARQFRNSIQLEQAFAPTGMMCLPKMLLHLTLNVYVGFSVMTLDVKGAFLMSPQPAKERAYVRVNGRIFKLLRCLPGQRTAASQWFQHFAGACIEFGMKQDPMQPTLLYIPGELYLTVHVDDVFMVGITQRLRGFVNYLKEKKSWNVEEKGPFKPGERFHYLKREFTLRPHHCDERCDRKQYDGLEKDVDLFSKFYRKTPLDANFTKKDTSPALEGGEVTRYRSIVGRLMYLAGERPDAQFAIQCLARHMAKPTAQAMKHAWHVCSYLFGTGGFGVRIDSKSRGQSVMDMRCSVDVEPQDQHLVEVVTDADYAGNQHDRKSTSSFQIFIDGNLVESKVRSQKAISLSSGEAEFVAMVAGCSEGLLIKHLWQQLTGQLCVLKIRSDSSAARAMTQRQGIGRVRHLDASLLWIQQKEKEKTVTVASIPTDLNCADLGTKCLGKKRRKALLWMLNMVDAIGDRVGEEEFRELEEQRNLKQSVKKFGKSKDMRIGLLMLLSTLTRATGVPNEGEVQVHEGLEWGWMTLCTCALLGALSLLRWLQVYVTEIFDGAKDYLVKYVKEIVSGKEVTLTLKIMMEEKETQTNEEVMSSDLQKCLKELEHTQRQCFSRETYIIELEERLKAVQETMDDFMIQVRLSDSRATKVEHQLCQLRMTERGKVVHFSSKCMRWRHARDLNMCKLCTQEGGVIDSHESSMTTILRTRHAQIETVPMANRPKLHSKRTASVLHLLFFPFSFLELNFFIVLTHAYASASDCQTAPPCG